MSPAGAEISLRDVTRENWREALLLSVHPDQLRFVADYAPVAAIALAKAYIRPGGLVWAPYAIYAGARMVGFIQLAYALHSPNQYWINHFFIDQAEQGRGYGRAALAAFIQFVCANHPGCRRLNLTVHPENTRAQRLYMRAGFHATGELQSGEPVYTLPLSEL